MLICGGTKYINEPHAGGGNPVLAMSGENADAMFNDILGTSLGVAKDGGYSAIDKTSFGADSTDKSSFFTGKPYVEDLGYAFLFRNYRADLGKWQMRDLIGYPDGWNNLAYCNNGIIDCFDLYGTIINKTGEIKNILNLLSSKSSTAKKIINELESSKYTVTIEEKSSGNGSITRGLNGENSYNGIGSDVKIIMNTYNTENSDPYGYGWSRPYELGVMHELIHALDMIKGTLNDTIIDGIKNSEIIACRETNRVLMELQKYDPENYEFYFPRSSYGGYKLPANAVIIE